MTEGHFTNTVWVSLPAKPTRTRVGRLQVGKVKIKINKYRENRHPTFDYDDSNGMLISIIVFNIYLYLDLQNWNRTSSEFKFLFYWAQMTLISLLTQRKTWFIQTQPKRLKLTETGLIYLSTITSGLVLLSFSLTTEVELVQLQCRFWVWITSFLLGL